MGEELADIVKELETVATWHSGVRRGKIEALIARLRSHAGLEPPDTSTPGNDATAPGNDATAPTNTGGATTAF